MILSDLAVKRPVLAAVISLLLIAFGLLAFDRLPLREYPDIDPPVVSVETRYPGAAANVVETRITRLIEDMVAGVEGIQSIESLSEDGRSTITIKFDVGRDIDGAANDVRDRVSRVSDDLPDEAEPPEIQKVDANEDVILWLNLASDRLTIPELSDYARRYLVDRFSVIDGVARVRVGGRQTFAMRVWLDRQALAARGLTVDEVEEALRAENLELPAGGVESRQRQFSVRTERAFQTAEDFARLTLARGKDGTLVHLGDVAQVELGTDEDRISFRGNGLPMVGIGIVKQSTANTLAVAEAAKGEMGRLNQTLPEGMKLHQSYDSSVFVRGAVHEVYKTLGGAILLVVLVIYLFLGSWRATLVPAVVVPVSLIATFLAIWVLGFSINILTLLALVLAIGLVVDDAIVVLENIHRRQVEHGETRLVAAYHGTRQVGFAVLATTLVLVAVFVPIAFLQGDVGRLFSEFALTMAAAVAFSMLVALTLSPMMASRILPQIQAPGRLSHTLDALFVRVRHGYGRILGWFLRHTWVTGLLLMSTLVVALWLLQHLPREYAPREDRGAFAVQVNGPEGASYAYMKEYMDEIERRLMPYIDSGEATRLLVRTPRGYEGTQTFNTGNATLVLGEFGQRRSGWVIMDEIRAKLADLPGVKAAPIMRQGFGSRVQKPVQFVIGGGTYEELAQWRDILLEKIEASNPGLTNLDWDYKETKPQLRVAIDQAQAADLGVTAGAIGRTLETMLGSRKVTSFIREGEEYDLILEGQRDSQRTPGALDNLQVRSRRSGELIPLANLVTVTEWADSRSLNRYNRLRAITLEANLAEGLALGRALDFLAGLVKAHLPQQARVDYKGQSRDFRASTAGVLFVFILGVVVVYLVLAAQFESWIHPLIIMLTVPLAMAGALLALWLTGQSLNLYSEIGLIMLVGLAAKNGILIVEFANQLREQGREFSAALMEASEIRLRPIVMTSITTAAGAVPLLLGSGAGAETRLVIGTVILAGVLAATLFTLFVVPVAYQVLARRTGSPGAVARRLAIEEAATLE